MPRMSDHLLPCHQEIEIECHASLHQCDLFSFFKILFSLLLSLSPLSSGTMDLSAPAPVVALLHWSHLLDPISPSTFPLSHRPLFLHAPSLALLCLWPRVTATSWQERKGRLSGAPWTSSAWRASSREERGVCWWLTAGHFLSTMHRTCKARSMSAAPSWWRGDCSRTRCLWLSCCNPTAKWRWGEAQQSRQWVLLCGRMWCQWPHFPFSFKAGLRYFCVCTNETT